MKRRKAKRFRPRGMMLTEACVALMLVGMVLGAVSLMLMRHARATDYFLNHRRAQLAAESCVERMRAGMVEVSDAAFTDEAGVRIEIQTVAADEVWQPLHRVAVSASIVGKHGRVAHYSVNTYVVPTPSQEGGDK